MATFSNGETGLSVRTKLNEVLQHLDGSGSELIVNNAGDPIALRVKSATSAHALFVNGSNGRVGVGTESPAAPLDVVGDAKIAGQLEVTSSAGGGIRVNDTSGGVDAFVTLATSGTDRFSLAADSGSGSFYLFDDANTTYPLVVVPGNANNTLVLSGSKVGVGKLSPAQALDVVGNIAVTGTVDGYDVSALGSKLAGIETGATADQTPAEIKSAYESNSNTNAFTDAEKSKLAGIEAGADVTDATNVDAAGALMESQLTNLSAIENINQQLKTTSSPTFGGMSVNGQVTITSSAGGGLRINDTSGGVDAFVTLATGGTDRFSLAADAATGAFYLFDEANITYPFAVLPGSVSNTLVMNDSKIGIGTASPSAKLQIDDGRVFIDAGTSSDDITVGGRTIQSSGVEVSSASGRSGFINRIPNSFNSVGANAGFQHLYPFSDGDDGYAFRASVGTTLSDTFWVKQQGDGYFAGNVGIGTASPATPLQVDGEIRGGRSTTQYISLSGDASASRIQSISSGKPLVIEADSGSTSVQIRTNTANSILLSPNSSTVLEVATTGAEVTGDFTVDASTLHVDSTNNRVGIGTASPSEKLDVVGNASITGQLEVTSAAGGGIRVNDTSGGVDAFVTLATGGTDRFSLSADASTGAFYLFDEANITYPFAVLPGSSSNALVLNNDKLGIGTASPSDELVVAGTARIGTGGSTADMKLEGDATPAITVGGSSSAAILTTYGNSGSSYHVGIEVPSNDSNDGFYVATDADNDGTVDTLAMKIKADGSVGIKTVSPAGDFDVNGTVFFPAVSTTALAANARIAPVGGEVLRSTSSIRYKTDVEDADAALSEAAVYDSRPVWYRSLAEADPGEWSFWGFIAEELHEIDPRLVDYAEDENGELRPDGVQYERFVVHLVNVAQRQKAQIDSLEARLAALEERVTP